MASIVKLPDSTIKQIAAGEVIVAPLNVVKELVENSLDAGATNVRIIIEDGGLKLIEIIDNGSGIALADAELLCQRHATSKLTHTEDLSRIATFGFRGEALASVSQTADLEVNSFNMVSDKKGWVGSYKHGELSAKPVEKFMQNPGTRIKVTNLFHTSKSRRLALSGNDSKKAISDLIIRLAIHHRERVTMTLKEAHSNDLVCILAPMDMKPCIGMFFGLEVENNLIEFMVQNSGEYCLTATVAFSYKKITTTCTPPHFILFVNDRLVGNDDLKKELLAVVLERLNLKQVMYIFYVALKVPPSDVDVNTHPAKATVSLRYQQEITTLIVEKLRSKLQDTQSSQFVTPLPVSKTKIKQEVVKMFPNLSHKSPSPTKPSSQVSSHRIDQERLKIMAPASLNNLQQNTQPEFAKPMIIPVKRGYEIIHTDPSQTTLNSHIQFPKRERRNIKLRSIHDLRELVTEETTKDGARVIKDSVFVGLFDHYSALIQHDTGLYAINFKSFLKEQIYQFFLFDFGNFPPIKISPPGNDITFIIKVHLDDMSKNEPEAFRKLKKKTVETIVAELDDHTDMLIDYFNLRIKHNKILTIPSIIPEHIPNLVFLGRFLIQLANDVNYSNERDCLHLIGRLFADFYSEPPANLKDLTVQKQYHDFIVNKLYPALKSYLLMPEWLFKKENISQISDTKDLYKVFERC